LEEYGVEVISVTEGTNSIARGVQIGAAADYSKQLAVRTRAGLAKRHEERAWTGGIPPYGYQVVTDATGRRRIAVNPFEAEVIRWLFGVYLSESIGTKELARRLEARGIATRRGAAWSFTTVRALLTNRMYLGEVTWGLRDMTLDRTTGRRVPRPAPTSDHQTYHDDALAIIEAEHFRRVQEKLAERARPQDGHRVARGIRPFSGFVFCDECGSVCYGKKSKNAKGEYYYYSCACRQRHGPAACQNAASVREDQLLADVTAACAAVFDHTDVLVELALRKGEAKTTTLRGRGDELRKQIGGIDTNLAKTHGLLLEPECDSAARSSFLRITGKMEVERERLRQALEDVAPRPGHPKGEQRSASRLRAHLKRRPRPTASSRTSSVRSS
jgi:site-specific DNA recombinase